MMESKKTLVFLRKSVRAFFKNMEKSGFSFDQIYWMFMERLVDYLKEGPLSWRMKSYLKFIELQKNLELSSSVKFRPSRSIKGLKGRL